MKTIRFYNTDGREIQEFVPLEPGKAGIYCCGPTVYNYAHIGNLRPYTHWDVLRRTFERFGYSVKHVMNITDVGHLTDDGDDGEDKMIKSAREKGMDVWDIAAFFTDAFFADIRRMNILLPHVCCRATDHIEIMQDMVKKLENNGLTYQAGGNVYFDTGKFPGYGKMALLDKQELKAGARIEVDINKRNPQDFVLWFTAGKFANQAMLWDSPWGKGYPGWHLECSAMSSHYLGEQFDIHTGGIDHIPVHHTNEIAQSEGAFRKKWVNYWIHNEFIIVKGGKMAKSHGEFLTLQSLLDQGFDALDYRYFLLGGHFRSQLVFSPDSLSSAQSARKSLVSRLNALWQELKGKSSAVKPGTIARTYLTAFDNALADNLNTPRALASLWGLIKDDSVAPGEKLTAALSMDEVLGLDLENCRAADQELTPDAEALQLLEERQQARTAKDWTLADRLRDRLLEQGWKVIDSPEGSKLEKS